MQGQQFFFLFVCFFVQPVRGYAAANGVSKAALLLLRRLAFPECESIQGHSAYSWLTEAPSSPVFLQALSGAPASTSRAGSIRLVISLFLSPLHLCLLLPPSPALHPTPASAAPTVTKALERTVTTASTCPLGLLRWASSCGPSLHFSLPFWASAIWFQSLKRTKPATDQHFLCYPGSKGLFGWVRWGWGCAHSLEETSVVIS